MKRMDNQDELNFRRFEEIYPVYRDMGRKVKAEFQKAKEIDLFNTKENQSLKDRIKELEESERKLISHIRGFILGSVSKNKLKRLINPYEQFNPRIGKQR